MERLTADGSNATYLDWVVRRLPAVQLEFFDMSRSQHESESVVWCKRREKRMRRQRLR